MGAEMYIKEVRKTEVIVHYSFGGSCFMEFKSRRRLLALCMSCILGLPDWSIASARDQALDKGHFGHCNRLSNGLKKRVSYIM